MFAILKSTSVSNGASTNIHFFYSVSEIGSTFCNLYRGWDLLGTTGMLDIALRHVWIEAFANLLCQYMVFNIIQYRIFFSFRIDPDRQDKESQSVVY